MKRIRFKLATGKYRYPKPGDFVQLFVQLVGWWGDCWAEVREAAEVVPGYKYIDYYTDQTNCGTYSVHESLPSCCTNTVYYQIRAIASRDELKKLGAHVVHCKEGTYGRSKNFNERSLPGLPPFLA